MPSAPVFVDTNILVYSHDEGDGVKQQLAAQWMRRLWTEQRGKTSIHVINEFYVTVTRQPRPLLTDEQAWKNVEMLMAWNPMALDDDLLARGRAFQQAYRLNWWDSLIVAAAHMQGCTAILTEDLQHGAIFGGIRVVNPFVAQVNEEPAGYDLLPVSRHRPRGRPRKPAAS